MGGFLDCGGMLNVFYLGMKMALLWKGMGMGRED